MFSIQFGDLATRLTRGLGIRGRASTGLDETLIGHVQIADLSVPPFVRDPRTGYPSALIIDPAGTLDSDDTVCGLVVAATTVVDSVQVAVTGTLAAIEWGVSVEYARHVEQAFTGAIGILTAQTDASSDPQPGATFLVRNLLSVRAFSGLASGLGLGLFAPLVLSPARNMRDGTYFSLPLPGLVLHPGDAVWVRVHEYVNGDSVVSSVTWTIREFAAI